MDAIARSDSVSGSDIEAAQRSFQSGDLSAAELYCSRIIKREPGSHRAYHLLASVLFAKAQACSEPAALLELATLLMGTAIGLLPDDHAYHQTLGDTYLATQNVDMAIASYRQAFRINPLAAVSSTDWLTFELIRLGEGRRLAELFDFFARQRPDLALERSADFFDRQQAAVGRGIPGILFNTMPKSGSIYIWKSLQEALDAPFCRVSLHLFPTDFLVPSWLETLATGGAVCQEHLDASAENLATLAEHAFDRLIVHVRDPRQATLSWVHHVDSLVGDAEKQRARVHPPLPADFDNRSFAERLDWHLDKHFPALIEWTKGWLRARKACGGDTNILFTTYEEFCRDPTAFYAKIADFYGLDRNILTVDVINLEKTEALHFRRGLADEWRSVFTEEQQRTVWQQMPGELCDRFGWQP